MYNKNEVKYRKFKFSDIKVKEVKRVKYKKCCYFCKHFQRNPDKKYYSHCLRDNKKLFEIQAMYAQYCLNWCSIKDYKEVKKVNKIPYFEMKVVRVKKENKDFWCGGMTIDGKQYKVFKRKKGIPYLKEFSKGNWVNGENLDKIRFPCFCSYSNNEEKGIGLFSVNNDFYYITNINFQKKVQEDISGGCYDLKEFIIRNNIHILKGKITIFKEE